MKLSGSKIILEVLKDKGVNTIFGYPGGTIIPFFDALYDEKDSFNIIRPAHEQNGVHAADGYARSTGKIGVFVATAGPGATNSVTGIANAYMDSVPLLVITSQVPTTLIGKDSFQEIDITGVSLSITKHSYLVRKIENLQTAVENAIEIALEGRPGPVLVDVPKDILLSEYEYIKKPDKKDEVYYEKNIENFNYAVELINNAKKPLIYAGGGIRISKNDKLLTEFANMLDIPVVNSFMGLGTIPRLNDLSLGFIGMHGSAKGNLAVSECDLLVAVGVRFSDRGISKSDTFAKKANIIHIEIDETEINKNLDNCIPLIGDLKYILNKIMNEVDKKERSKWVKEIEVEEYKENESDYLPGNIIRKINSYYKEKTIVATDVGQHQMWTGQFWSFNNSNEFITSGGLGAMGFGIGAAIGAKIANPDKNVILITGDGSFNMCCQELITISRYNIPIIIIMFNNQALGMVRQWQKMFNNERYSQTDNFDCVDYGMLVASYGIKYFKCENLKELDNSLIEIKDYKTPVFIECKIDRDCGVFPIVPSGKSIYDYIID